MSEDPQPPSWARNNVASIVTWVLIGIGAAVAWGVSTAHSSTTADHVRELRTAARDCRTDRAAIHSDVRLLQAGSARSERQIADYAIAVSRLERAVSRLEVIVQALDRAKER